KLPLKLAPGAGADQYLVSNSDKLPLHDLTFYKNESDGWHVATLPEFAPTATTKPSTKPATTTPATTAPAPTTAAVAAAQPPASLAENDILVTQHSDPKWDNREAASLRLRDLGVAAKPKLEAHLKPTKDPEITFRIERLIAAHTHDPQPGEQPQPAP